MSACDRVPTFIVDREPSIAVTDNAGRTFSIGSVQTPPPGEYRFLRVWVDGRVDVRELLTFNGPGPWRAYVGRTRIPASLAQDALHTIDSTSPATAPADSRAPCVLAYDSANGGPWHGCAYADIAQRVVSDVPRLTAPDVSPRCSDRVCQIRLLRELPAFGHEATGGVLQDIVVDASGAIWCASAEGEPSGQTITLRVERAAVASADAARVFAWLSRGTAIASSDQFSTVAESVMVRGRGGDWTRLSASDGQPVRARWGRIADRLPAACRLTH